MSPRTNGCLVRFVGRRRINDGLLKTVLTTVVAILCPPYFVWWLYQAKRTRNTWGETLFQLFSWGELPADEADEDSVVVHSLPAEVVPLQTLSGDQIGNVRFVCISDTHMRHTALSPLPMGDVLVHCGDFSNFGSLAEVQEFATWFGSQPHRVKLVVPGNHDMIMDKPYYDEFWGDWSRTKESHDAAVRSFDEIGAQLLVDKTITIDGLKVHGSPWVTQYASWKTAFNKTETEMAELWETLPQEVDVLLTHMPPYGFGDREDVGSRTGCPHLARRALEIRPWVHVFGHVHADRGVFRSSGASTTFVNASSTSDYYTVGKRHALVFDVPCRQPK